MSLQYHYYLVHFRAEWLLALSAVGIAADRFSVVRIKNLEDHPVVYHSRERKASLRSGEPIVYGKATYQDKELFRSTERDA